ncbi:dTDP-4-dehydrorhamnose 3,5-epimerase family protein, partial [Xanthobacter aminoxidans]|uniref:dTDP-4-dehydrorhamnose 3,5-epimerase family protein n=1 Tax=Xanthobacter aminoxidans TaxID=186280 RepID=UPI0037265602
MTAFTPLSLPEVVLVQPRRFGDSRGYFRETYVKPRYAQNGIAADFVQDNESLSAEVGAVRGLHMQAPPFAQAKLVRVLSGAIYDVAVD